MVKSGSTFVFKTLSSSEHCLCKFSKSFLEDMYLEPNIKEWRMKLALICCLCSIVCAGG